MSPGTGVGNGWKRDRAGGRGQHGRAHYQHIIDVEFHCDFSQKETKYVAPIAEGVFGSEQSSGRMTANSEMQTMFGLPPYRDVEACY
jgi:hypothetical protein